MKRNYLLLFLILDCLAVLSGILTSRVSLVGRVGINFFYKEYRFFKVWWQAALVFLAVMIVIFLILYLIDKRVTGMARQAGLLISLLLFLSGLYITFQDFRQDLSHRWLGERFHMGIYLYWVGMCLVSLFFMVTARPYTHKDVTKSGVSNRGENENAKVRAEK